MSKKIRYLFMFIFILILGGNILNECPLDTSHHKFQSKDGQFKTFYVPFTGGWNGVSMLKKDFELRNDTSIVIYRLSEKNIFKFWKWREYCFDPEWQFIHVDDAE